MTLDPHSPISQKHPFSSGLTFRGRNTHTRNLTNRNQNDQNWWFGKCISFKDSVVLGIYVNFGCFLGKLKTPFMAKERISFKQLFHCCLTWTWSIQKKGPSGFAFDCLSLLSKFFVAPLWIRIPVIHVKPRCFFSSEIPLHDWNCFFPQYFFGFVPPPPPGWLYMFTLGNPKLNFHLPGLHPKGFCTTSSAHHSSMFFPAI